MIHTESGSLDRLKPQTIIERAADITWIEEYIRNTN